MLSLENYEKDDNHKIEMMREGKEVAFQDGNLFFQNNKYTTCFY